MTARPFSFYPEQRDSDQEGDGETSKPAASYTPSEGGGTAWLDGNVSGRSRPIYNHAVDRGRESCTFSVLG